MSRAAASRRLVTLLEVSIESFRQVRRASLALAPGINLLTGANAQGKTTVLEAVGYLSFGRSFRTARDRECLPWPDKSAKPPAEPVKSVLAGRVTTGRTRHEVRVVLEGSHKAVWLDGKSLRGLSGLWGLLPTVLLTPADLQLVQGQPVRRRHALDSLMGQTDPASLALLAAFNRAVTSRTALLRRRVPPTDKQYDAFEATLAEAAARILALREDLVGRLDRAVGPALEALAGGRDHLRLVYEPGFPADAGITPEAIRSIPPPHLEDALRRHWRAARAADAERAHTRHGPHRDDVRFDLNGTDARPYASQGQARSCVLALRLAELDVLAEDPARQPLLLMDDILGELDASRTEHFLHLVGRREVQTLLTATDATRLEKNLPVARRFRVAGGQVTPVDTTGG